MAPHSFPAAQGWSPAHQSSTQWSGSYIATTSSTMERPMGSIPIVMGPTRQPLHGPIGQLGVVLNGTIPDIHTCGRQSLVDSTDAMQVRVTWPPTIHCTSASRGTSMDLQLWIRLRQMAWHRVVIMVLGAPQAIHHHGFLCSFSPRHAGSRVPQGQWSRPIGQCNPETLHTWGLECWQPMGPTSIDSIHGH